MRWSKWANFAEFNFANEQFSDKDFAHFDPLFQRKKKYQISQNLGAKSAKLNSAKISSARISSLKVIIYNLYGFGSFWVVLARFEWFWLVYAKFHKYKKLFFFFYRLVM